ncbi:hypothetical protein [Nostoc sp. CHAB 5715]|nr:hypothetical protein [Nostoc sp. CHAB 5715]MCC5623636.1 hypothetical protein [Nostoc sp. CHAB 5715]
MGKMREMREMREQGKNSQLLTPHSALMMRPTQVQKICVFVCLKEPA